MLKQVMMIGLVLSVFQASSELFGSEGDQEYGQEVVLYEEDDQTEDSVYGVPQSAIDGLYEFLSDNSSENPWIIPLDLTYEESVMIFRDWGENVVVRPLLTIQSLSTACGGFMIHIFQEDMYQDEIYVISGVCVYIQYEKAVESDVPLHLVEAMRTFLEENSSENRLVIRQEDRIALLLAEKIEMDANFIVSAFLESYSFSEDSHLLCGDISLLLYEDGVSHFGSAYNFRGVCIYYQIEEPQIATPPAAPAPVAPQLPEAGSKVGGRIALGMFLVAFSGALALKQSHQIGG